MLKDRHIFPFGDVMSVFGIEHLYVNKDVNISILQILFICFLMDNVQTNNQRHTFLKYDKNDGQ